MPDTIGCRVCDEGFAEPVDSLLFLGRSPEDIARDLDQPREEFAKVVRGHLFSKHVQRCTPENYQMLIVSYMGDIRKMLDREMKRPIHKQDVRRIAQCFKGTQWAVSQIGKMEGYVTGGKTISGRANNLIEALNEFAKANPDAAKRVREAAAREKPVLIAGPKPETAAKPVPKAHVVEPEKPPVYTNVTGPDGT